MFRYFDVNWIKTKFTHNEDGCFVHFENFTKSQMKKKECYCKLVTNGTK